MSAFILESSPFIPQLRQRHCVCFYQHKKVNRLQLSDDEHVDDKLLSKPGLLISIYWELIGCGLVSMQPLAGNC